MCNICLMASICAQANRVNHICNQGSTASSNTLGARLLAPAGQRPANMAECCLRLSVVAKSNRGLLPVLCSAGGSPLFSRQDFNRMPCITSMTSIRNGAADVTQLQVARAGADRLEGKFDPVLAASKADGKQRKVPSRGSSDLTVPSKLRQGAK